ncbi:MAG: thioredoxin domain-containing protein [Thermoanaerobaculia bacterium]
MRRRIPAFPAEPSPWTCRPGPAPRAGALASALALALALFSCGAGPGSTADGVSTAEEPEGPAPEDPGHTERQGPNRLEGESSPYLLLHADNPVDWYPWGEEALERAREEDKPIFLSVGYSSCYWCHVMERKVFSDPEIAALMNRWFVNVKVDREERPDLDEIYMTATQLMTRSGGWPNSVFLTPDLEPFYAGTYFPPEAEHGRPGFPTVLRRIHEGWTERRGDLEGDAARVADALRQALSARGEPAESVPGEAAAQAAVRAVSESYDEAHGGFGRAPKFPTPGKLLLLWEAGEAGGEEHGMVVETLRRMGRGGIYDHLEGGFHRYSTDARWLVPHFEKMLYDNAHLAELLALAWQETGDPELARLARGTLDFVLRELTRSEGGFKSAIDAQTDGEEGVYYVWREEELRSVLGDEGFDLLAPIYGFDGRPSFEGDRHVLHLTAPLDEHAEGLEISREELLERLQPHLERLLAARGERDRPLVDDKVLSDWNGMMIAGMARAGAILEEPRYVEAAEKAARFVLERLGPDPEPSSGAGLPLRHAWRGGEARIDAFLDDYAFLLRGLVALHEATGEERWLTHATRLADELERRLATPGGGYYLSKARPELLVQPLTVTGGALPSGNAVAAHALLALAEETGEERFRARAERSLRAFAPHLERFPEAVPMLAAAVLRYHREAPDDGGGEGATERADRRR